MRYANITTYDINNGPGFRVSLFVQGCPIHCEGCFNPETWDFKEGKYFTDDVYCVLLNALKDKHISGLSILGGEPLADKNALIVGDLCQRIKNRYPDKNIWLWSGFDYNQILDKSKQKDDIKDHHVLGIRKVLEYCDVLVTGPFVKSQKDLSIPWRGSRNQEIHYLK